VNLDSITVIEARAAIAARELSAMELLDAVLDRVRARNEELVAYLLIDDEGARAAAGAADRAARRGDRRPLLGIPVCVKDVIDVAGLPTTAGAAGWRRLPRSDATAVARVRAAGAVIVGKGNTNEFAYGIDGRNPHWGDARNPHDRERISGGSSSGPAVAVATGMALAGLGTDTTGSLRVPAALCGIVGLRPTLGAVPTDGVVPLAFSYDVVGPLARSAADAAVLWAVLNGDGKEPSARRRRVRLLAGISAVVQPAVACGTRAIAELLHAEPIELPALHDVKAIHTTLQTAEASAAHSDWFDQQRERYSSVVRERLELGRKIPAIDYVHAQRGRRAAAEQFVEAMTRERAGALLTHTTPTVAPRLDGDEAAQRASLLQTVLPLSQTAGPVLAIPAGTDEADLPYGVQLAGRPGDEQTLLRLAMMIESQRHA
jgi:aspartyl-tRNA(Asn)/glutamyl-tRNA(Gln) amidotransferase subunit A